MEEMSGFSLYALKSVHAVSVHVYSLALNSEGCRQQTKSWVNLEGMNNGGTETMDAVKGHQNKKRD